LPEPGCHRPPQVTAMLDAVAIGGQAATSTRIGSIQFRIPVFWVNIACYCLNVSGAAWVQIPVSRSLYRGVRTA
jgi:hypothetical protein